MNAPLFVGGVCFRKKKEAKHGFPVRKRRLTIFHQKFSNIAAFLSMCKIWVRKKVVLEH